MRDGPNPTVEHNGELAIIWVRPGSPVKGLGGLISETISANTHVTLRAIGAGAINQALKGTISARQDLFKKGHDLVIRPDFTSVPGKDGKPISAIVLSCFLS